VKTLIQDVGAFHAACDVPVLQIPAVPARDRVALRRSLIDEEVNKELLPAMDAGNIVELADALADSIYVIVGTALEYGIPLDRVWQAVQAANMAKVDPATGKVHRRDDGKILKPPDWTPPDIEAALR
jgi:predicted HAD superfamily Cof-like phosphohydrolase